MPWIALYGAVFVCVALTISERASRQIRRHAASCVEWMQFVMICEADGAEPEKRLGVENFQASRVALRRCRALAGPWLLISRGML